MTDILERESKAEISEDHATSNISEHFDSAANLTDEIHALENTMQVHVKNLAFEEAAVARDKILELKQRLLRPR